MATLTKEFKQVYNAGVQSEQEIIEAMVQAGFPARASNRRENIDLDIDCWLGELSISIKTSHATLKSGNLCFELECLQASDGKWLPSWFYRGKAAMYVIRVGDALYMINKADLLGYVAECGWDKVVTNTSKVKNTQVCYRFSDARVGLVSLQTLLNDGIAQKLGFTVQ